MLLFLELLMDTAITFLTTIADLLRDRGYTVPEDNSKAFVMMTKFPYTVEDVKRKT